MTAVKPKCSECDVDIDGSIVTYVDNEPVCKSCLHMEVDVTPADIDKVLETAFWPPDLKLIPAFFLLRPRLCR